MVGDGSANPDVSASSEGVETKTEIRVSFDRFLDPATITPEAIILRSGALDRGTTLRWDFQAGTDFEDRFDDGPPTQIVAIRPTSDLDENNQYRVIVTDRLRGLLGERAEPFEATFQTRTYAVGEAPGELPVEPPESPPAPAQQIEGSWGLSGTSCSDDPPPVECSASCGWGSGPCHRMLVDGVAYDPALVDFRYPEPAMDLVLCELDADAGCTPVLDVPSPYKDLFDYSAQWPRWHLVEPGAPERSYVVYKILGVPGIDGGQMPRDYNARDHEAYEITGFEDSVSIAQAFRRWIAAGAPR